MDEKKLAIILFALALIVVGYFVYKRIKSQKEANDTGGDVGLGITPDGGGLA